MAWTDTTANNLLTALLALVEARQGMIDRRFLAQQMRLMFAHPDRAHTLLSQRELAHYLKLLRN